MIKRTKFKSLAQRQMKIERDDLTGHIWLKDAKTGGRIAQVETLTDVHGNYFVDDEGGLVAQ